MRFGDNAATNQQYYCDDNSIHLYLFNILVMAKRVMFGSKSRLNEQAYFMEN